MNSKCYCLIMAGGKGTRLWPESTEKKPKQYLSLVGEGSLLEQTLERFASIIPIENRFIVTTRDQSELAFISSNKKILKESLILEPSGRNTAPCILLSMATLEKLGASDEDIIAIMPSDHVILDKNGFIKSFEQAVRLSSETNTITTIGIKPHFPQTGYGYIKKGEDLNSGARVSEFKEKPDFETAKKYLATGNYLWNAGMFMAKLGVFKREFKKHSQETFSFYEQLLSAIGNEKNLEEVYSKIPKDSIDYAIMEKSTEVTTIPASFDWNDLGSWEALEAVIDSTNGNTIVDAKSIFMKDSTGNVVYAPEKFVSLINVKDMVVVSNDKSVMVMPKADAQRVREIVEYLKSENSKELL